MPKKIIMRPKVDPVIIKVNNVYCQIEGLSDEVIIEKLDRGLSFEILGYEFTKAFKTGWWDPKKSKWVKWDGREHLFSKKHKFLTGLLPRVKKILGAQGVEYKIEDVRKPVPFNDPIPTKNIESRPYQDRAVEVALKHKGGIVSSCTGSGKSVMITRLLSQANVKALVCVIGIDLLYQMKEVFEKMLGTKVGIIGDGKVDIKRINVCTVWTAANALGNKYVPFDDEDWSKKEMFNKKNSSKIAKVIKGSEMIIFDECQILATKTLQLINKAAKNAYYKYGFSGTPWREDGSDLLLEAVCGPTIIEITASELIRSGYLTRPKIKFIDVPESPDLTFLSTYPTIYKKYIVENETRNKKIVNIAKKLVKSGRSTLILVKNIKHGSILLSMLEQDLVVYFIRGSVNSDERNRIRHQFLKGEVDIIIASSVFDTGVDLPSLDALILANSGKSRGRALQRIGRAIRKAPGKKDAIVIDFMDNAKYLTKHSNERLKTYKRESEFIVSVQKAKNGKKKKTKRLPKWEEW